MYWVRDLAWASGGVGLLIRFEEHLYALGKRREGKTVILMGLCLGRNKQKPTAFFNCWVEPVTV